MFKEFKEFAVKGNVIDLAVGLVVGSAFTKIVTSLVNDIITPPLGLLLGKIDFANLFITLSRGRHFDTVAQARAAGATIIAYGSFINAIIEFVIVAFIMFLVVRQINRWKRQPVPDTKDCPFCLSKVPLHAVRCPSCTSELKDEYQDLPA